MTLRVIDGFDLYNGVGASPGLQAKWGAPVSLLATVAVASMQAGRFGGQCVRLTGAGSSAANTYIPRTLPGSYGSICEGVAYRNSNVANQHATFAPILSFSETTTFHVHIGVDTAGKLWIARASSGTAGTQLAITAGQVVLNATWHYIIVEATIHDTTGSVRVLVDGAEVLNVTGQDTRNAGTGVVNQINLHNTHGVSVTNTSDFDDLYLDDVATSLGEMRVETIRPTADTADKDFTRSTGADNYALVDEATVDVADYVQGSVVGDLDLYAMGDLSTTPASIPAVQLTAFANKTDAASRDLALVADVGGTQATSANLPLAATVGKHDAIMATKPGGGAWDSTAVNALLAGPKVAL